MTTKQDVLECSISNFTKFGSKRFTMDELATTLGISKKTIYKFYSSKEDLVIASVKYLIDDYNQVVDEIISQCPDPLFCILKIYEKGFERLSYFKPSFIFGLKKYYPLANKLFDEFRHRFVREKVYSLLVKAQEQGLLVDEVNLNLFCDLYFNRIEEIAFLHDNLFQRYSSQELLDHFIVYSLRGITKTTYVFPKLK